MNSDASQEPAPGAAADAMQEEPEVVEVEPPLRGCKEMNWEINGRKERLFSQIIVAGVKAFLTNRANVKPDARGRGGQTYEKKLVWENPTDGIITMLKKSEAFRDAVWPSVDAQLRGTGAGSEQAPVHLRHGAS